MSKRVNLIAVLMMALMLLFTISCEGPDGADGVDGINGMDGADGADGMDGSDGADGAAGNLSCLGCHTQLRMDEITADYETSVHGEGARAPRGTSASCARCHSSEGFIAFVNAPTADQAGIPVPSRISCVTCHGNHRSLEDDITAPLRSTAPIVAIADESGATTFDFGNASNLCGTCHQSRRGYDYYEALDSVSIDGVMTEVGAGNVGINSSHAGPHHGPQTNVLFGDGGYGTSSEATHSGLGCTTCHMGAEESHTFNPEVATCNTSGCHTGATDFDINGKQASFDTRMAAIAEALVAAGALGGDATEGYHPAVSIVTEAQFKAFWNYMYCYEDHSHGVHNPGYISTMLGQAEALLGL